MILLFHELSNKAHQYCIPIKKFKELVEKNPEAEIHFDDGRRGIMALEPSYLKNLAKKITIFLVPNWIKNIDIPEHEQYSDFLDFEDFEKLVSYGIELGSHSLTHTDLTRESDTRLKEELQYSQEWIAKRFGVIVNKFSVPYGREDKRVISRAFVYYDKVYTLKSELGMKRTLILQDLKKSQCL